MVRGPGPRFSIVRTRLERSFRGSEQVSVVNETLDDKLFFDGFRQITPHNLKIQRLLFRRHRQLRLSPTSPKARGWNERQINGAESDNGCETARSESASPRPSKPGTIQRSRPVHVRNPPGYGPRALAHGRIPR